MLKPIFDRIVVKPDAAPDQSAGGIILPDAAKEKPQRGTVLAVGPGKIEDQGEFEFDRTGTCMPVKVGDVVIYGRYTGTELKVDGEGVVILRADDVFAVLEA